MSRAGVRVRNVRARLLGVALLVLAVAAVWFLPFADWLDAAAAWVAANPVRGALLYLAGAGFAGIAMTPGWIPMMLGGFLFGAVKGFVFALLGIVFGATAAFFVGRSLSRGWIEERIRKHGRLRAIDRAVDDNAFTVVLLSRLAFVVPYNLLNYFYGLTSVKTSTFVAATAVGMLPIVAMYVYLGTLARDIDALLGGGGAPDEVRWWLAAVALAAIVTVVLVIRRSAGRLLADDMADPSAGSMADKADDDSAAV